MNTKSFREYFLGLVFLTLACACGGGGGGGRIASPTLNINPPQLPAAPVTEAVSVVGVISSFGSVTVNGIRYATDATTVTLNGRAASFSELEIGQIVTLEGTIEVDNPRGTADRVDCEATVLGPVDNIDAALSELMVMGQTVVTDADTVFHPSIDPGTFSGLAVGSNAQVSGFLNANREIVATRIEPAPPSAGVQVVGSVVGLDLANMLFRFNRLIVDYRSAALMDLPGDMPANDMFLVARGSLTDGILVVDRLEGLYDSLGGTPRERTQAHGSITRYNSSTDFDLNGFSVTTDAGTAFINGTSNDLQANAEITVDGDFSGNGSTIVANEVIFGSLLDPTTTLTLDFRDFTEISVPTIFRVTVNQGPDFAVEVAVDADVADRIDVTQTGTKLNLALSFGDSNIDTLHAFVTMPVLDRIDLTGVVHATLNDFNQQQMTVNVGNVSRLKGNALMIGDLTANVSGVSLLDFGDIRPIGNVDVNVSGVSQATFNMDVGTTMAGSVGTGQGTGVSELYYYGTDVTVDVTTDGLSRVTRLGDTRF